MHIIVSDNNKSGHSKFIIALDKISQDTPNLLLFQTIISRDTPNLLLLQTIINQDTPNSLLRLEIINQDTLDLFPPETMELRRPAYPLTIEAYIHTIK